MGLISPVHELSSREKSKKKKLDIAEPGFEPGAAEWEVWLLPLCYAATETPEWSTFLFAAYNEASVII